MSETTADDRTVTGVIFHMMEDGRMGIELRGGSVCIAMLSGRAKRQKLKLGAGDHVLVRLLAPKYTRGFVKGRVPWTLAAKDGTLNNED